MLAVMIITRTFESVPTGLVSIGELIAFCCSFPLLSHPWLKTDNGAAAFVVGLGIVGTTMLANTVFSLARQESRTK
jgi:hypothetical protein